jgi:uncharacterized membrane protein YhhN
MAVALTIVCALLVVALLVAESSDHKTFKALTKMPASLGFIAVALTHGAASRGTFGKVVLLALVLGAVGDAALLSKEKKPFLLGIAAFLLSHVAYIVAFVVLRVSWVGVPAALVVLIPIAIHVRRWIGDDAGELGGPVTAYVVVITAMVACAAGAIARVVDVQRMVLLAAAILFFVSDICVARDRFVAPGFVNRLLGLPLYYGAQLLFAWSLAIH